MKDIKITAPPPKDSQAGVMGLNPFASTPTTFVLREDGVMAASTASIPLQLGLAGTSFFSEGSTTLGSIISIPSPFGNMDLPTIFIGNVDASFLFKNPFEQYLQ